MNASHLALNMTPGRSRRRVAAMRSVRIWAAVSSSAALILLSPVVAFFMVIAAEVLIDGLMEAGVTGVSAIAIGAIGWVQFRRIWRSEIAQLSGSSAN